MECWAVFIDFNLITLASIISVFLICSHYWTHSPLKFKSNQNFSIPRITGAGKSRWCSMEIHQLFSPLVSFKFFFHAPPPPTYHRALFAPINFGTDFDSPLEQSWHTLFNFLLQVSNEFLTAFPCKSVSLTYHFFFFFFAYSHLNKLGVLNCW